MSGAYNRNFTVWFIFSTCTFVLNAVKEPGILEGGVR